MCRIFDDCIDARRHPLLVARGQVATEACVVRQDAVHTLKEAPAQQFITGSGLVFGIEFPDQVG